MGLPYNHHAVVVFFRLEEHWDRPRACRVARFVDFVPYKCFCGQLGQDTLCSGQPRVCCTWTHEGQPHSHLLSPERPTGNSIQPIPLSRALCHSPALGIAYQHGSLLFAYTMTAT